jgi:twinkle protein
VLQKVESKEIRKEPCPRCRESGHDRKGDNLGVFDDGHVYCYKCGHYANGNGVTTNVVEHREKGNFEMSGVAGPIKDRRISQRIVEKFGVTLEYKGTDIVKHHYPYYNRDTGKMSGVKTRIVNNKTFPYQGDSSNLALFGQHLYGEGGRAVTITEGEIDAMAVSEMFDGKWPVVSIRTGAAGAKTDIKNNLEWLESFESIVLCFDNDDAGSKALDQVLPLFSHGKAKVVKLPLKDAGEMLVQGKLQEFTRAWWDAKPYKPSGLINGADLYDRIINSPIVESVPYPWSCLNILTHGFRPKELVTFTSGSGMGKSQVTRELSHYLLRQTSDNIGIMALEESVDLTGKGIMSIEANLPLPTLRNDPDIPKSDHIKWFNMTLGTGRFTLMEHFGSTGEDNLLSKLRYMIKGTDCKWVIIDHLSIIVSDQENNDERKAIDSIMTKFRTIVEETGVGIFLVSHLKRPDGKAHEDGGKISLGQLRGSAAIAQLSDMVIGLERDQQHEDLTIRNTTTVRVLKNRYSGETGPACYLLYDRDTGRMVETCNPETGDVDDEEF